MLNEFSTCTTKYFWVVIFGKTLTEALTIKSQNIGESTKNFASKKFNFDSLGRNKWKHKSFGSSKNHALILVDHYSAIYSIRYIGMVFKWPQRPIFSFIAIHCIKIKHLFAKYFGRCADILTFNSECVIWIVSRWEKNLSNFLLSSIFLLIPTFSRFKRLFLLEAYLWNLIRFRKEALNWLMTPN